MISSRTLGRALAALLLAAIAYTAPSLPLHAAPPPSPHIKVTHSFLIGHWTDDGDCSKTIEFHADGSFTVPSGAMGLWVLEQDRLTFLGSAGTRSARLQAPDQDTILLIHEDGSVGRSTRCIAAIRPSADEPPLLTI